MERADFPWASVMQLRCYGLGSPSQSPTARAQLALLPYLLSSCHPDATAAAFDPVFTDTDHKVLRGCACAVLTEQAAAAYTLTEPALFYMPHCGAGLYNDVLDANWSPSHLRHLAILGNSFTTILVRSAPVRAHKRSAAEVPIGCVIRSFRCSKKAPRTCARLCSCCQSHDVS